MHAELQALAETALGALSGRVPGAGARAHVTRRVVVTGTEVERFEVRGVSLRTDRWIRTRDAIAIHDDGPPTSAMPLAREEVRRERADHGPPMPETDAAALAAAANHHRTEWLEEHSVWLETDGSRVEERVRRTWTEDDGWITSYNRLPLAVPPDKDHGEEPRLASSVVCDPTATLALCTLAAQAQAQTPSLRLGRQSIASRAVSLVRDPRAATGLPRFDGEGVERRYHPLIVRGVLVGTVSDRRTAAQWGVSRSSGSLDSNGIDTGPFVDTLALTPGSGGDLDELALRCENGLLLHGPIERGSSSDGRQGFLCCGREIADGVPAAAAGPVFLPLRSLPDLLRGIVAVGEEAVLAAIPGPASGPVVGPMPAVLATLSDLS